MSERNLVWNDDLKMRLIRVGALQPFDRFDWQHGRLTVLWPFFGSQALLWQL